MLRPIRDDALLKEKSVGGSRHYVPERQADPAPTIVLAHGFSGVKEMFLDSYAEAFAQVGLASLVFDHRNFGASEGAPRQEIDRIESLFTSRVRSSPDDFWCTDRMVGGTVAMPPITCLY